MSLGEAGPQDTDGAGFDTLIDIEDLEGSSFGDTLAGNSGGNFILGGGGNDFLMSFAGNDFLAGHEGDDILDGGDNDDNARTAAEQPITPAISRSLRGRRCLALDRRRPEHQGGGGFDTLIAIENLTGSAFNDALTGDAGANLLMGDAGNDVLAGLAGADVLDGGAGDDTADYSASTDHVAINLAANPANGGDAFGDTLLNIENVVGWASTIPSSAMPQPTLSPAAPATMRFRAARAPTC